MIVVDTRVVIWLASDPSLLSAAATDAIRTARKNGGVGISCISLFELGWLARNQRIVPLVTKDKMIRKAKALSVIW
jgi:PIN domain nuclease of toxin-antitoxin system